MKGDNAKSHNYTTYRLSGVFGTPIVLSPLFREEWNEKSDGKNEELKKQLQAIRAAKAAEIEVWAIDEVGAKLEEYLEKND